MRRSALGLLALLLAGCSNAGRGESALERGIEALDEGRPRTARVEFLNAIQAAPGDGRIRILQARTYLALGEGAAAQAELDQALKLGVPAGAVRHLMAHALLLQDQPRAALAETQAGSADPVYAARMRGRAHMMLGDQAAAGLAFDEALAAAPENASVWADIARFRRAGGDLAGAMTAADRAVRADPRLVEALILRGELTRSQYGLRAALPWFDRALEVEPTNLTALLEKAATLGEAGENREMLRTTRKVLALSGGNPMAFYLQAMMAARGGNFPLASSLYRRTGGAFEKQPAGMLLASAIDFQTGNVEQAITRLVALTELQPRNRKARRLLAAAQFRKGEHRAAFETLRPIVERPDADSYSLRLAGQALQQLGDPAAAAYLARSAQPQRSAATSLWSEPVGEAQLAMLRAEADAAPGDASAQVTLIGALLSSGLGDEALARALALQSRNSGAPDAHVLVGDARGLTGDFAGAAEEYRKAANLSFTEPVALRLIEALQQSGQQAAAAQALALFLEQNPRNVSAQLLAAGGFMEAGRWAEAARIYERLRRQLGDRDAVLLNNLAWAYAELGRYDDALPLATRAWQLDRSNASTADTLGWLLFKSGRDKARGLVLLERAARAAPADAEIREHLEAARKG